MKTKNLLVVFLLCSANNLMAQTSDSIKSYIDSALYFMKTKPFYGNNRNWSQIRDSAYLKAAGAKNYKQAFPAIAYAFQQLKDYHGVVAGEDTFYRYPPPVNFDVILSPGIKKEFLKGPKIVAAFLGDSTAYFAH